MVSIEQIQKQHNCEYTCTTPLNLYDSKKCDRLATQASIGRHLKVVSPTPTDNALQVCLCEDDYSAWLPLENLTNLVLSSTPYAPVSVSRPEIEARLPAVIAFAQAAMKQPNQYLWGGTVSPNYDCSGLIQAAFAHSGIWLPRDSYQQAAFTQAISMKELQLGDLIFFATTDKVNHVALCLGDGYYIHSSGIEMGRNGIGIDSLSEKGARVSRSYYQQFWGVGRVMSSYSPKP